MADPFESLTESQRICLELIAENKSSKEIAFETGLSPTTVDTYVARAMAAIGAMNRREAARMFIEYQQSRKSGSRPERLEIGRQPSNPEITPTHGVRWSRWNLLLRQLPPIGGHLYELTTVQRFFTVAKLSVLTTILVAALLTIYFWLNGFSLR